MKRIPSIVCRTAATLLAALSFAPTVATAAETAAPPSHLKAYGLDWLNYLDPADVPTTRYATCLVDSGVRETPDTPATSPDGPIIARLAVDGGPGEPEGESPEQLHGTRMAMAMAAPVNDWGTIGAWTGGRIVSVRATTAEETTFRPEYYAKALNVCLDYQEDTGTPIAAVNLSLGCGGCTLTSEQEKVLGDRVGKAHVNGMSIVAAAGNDSGALQLPASIPGVFAVAGGDLSGGLCAYSSFSQQVAVIGPACPVDLADPLSGSPGSDEGGGSSTATAVTSNLMGVLRSLRPDASWTQVEGWVRDSARMVNGQPMLDGRAAAQAAGLGATVARAEARQSSTSTALAYVAQAPITATPPPGIAAPVEKGQAERLARPKVVSASWVRGVLRLRVINQPVQARLEVVAERLKRDGIRVRSTRRLVRTSGYMRVRTAWRPGRLSLRFLPNGKGDKRRASGPVLLYRHGHHFR